ncbi:hypothetical protein QR685DRAFT_206518 [Neurospora intermedia]|uniref:Uncharacterized protein n=1 Tax=Neurospora intermedia TaxID=5142 RepID=A0ABR3DIB9_NEUIN
MSESGGNDYRAKQTQGCEGARDGRMARRGELLTRGGGMTTKRQGEFQNETRSSNTQLAATQPVPGTAGVFELSSPAPPWGFYRGAYRCLRAGSTVLYSESGWAMSRGTISVSTKVRTWETVTTPKARDRNDGRNPSFALSHSLSLSLFIHPIIFFIFFMFSPGPVLLTAVSPSGDADWLLVEQVGHLEHVRTADRSQPRRSA